MRTTTGVNKARKRLEEDMDTRRTSFIEAVRESLIDAGHELDTGHGVSRVDDIGIYMEVGKQDSGGAFRTHYNGRLYYTLGDYGNKQTYPEPKKGFDVAKAVERILERVEGGKRRKEARKKSDEKKKAAKVTLRRACAKIEMDEHNRPKDWSDEADLRWDKKSPETLRKVKTLDADRVEATFALTPEMFEKVVKLIDVIG